jgi:VanZ family protein
MAPHDASQSPLLMSKPALILVGLLIAYGSLYPFSFAAAPPDAWLHLFGDLRLNQSRGDILGNIALFLPWGLVGMWAFGGSRGARISATLGGGMLLAVGVQVLQLWLPARDAALGDAVWNSLGIVLGMGLARALPGRMATARHQEAALPLALIAAWLAVQWLPLVPSLDLSLIASQLRRAIGPPEGSPGRLVLAAVSALVLGRLLGRLLGAARAELAHPLLIAVAIWAKPLFVQSHFDPAEMAGLTLGLVLWPLLRGRRLDNDIALAMLMIAALTLEALAPYTLLGEAQAIHWLPFAAMLEGSMLNNLRSLGGSLFVYGATLYLVQCATGRALVFSVGLAVWVAGLELAQALLPNRSPDMTEALLVLLAGWICARGAPPSAMPAAARPTAREGERRGRRPWLPLLALPSALVLALVLALSALLRLPGIPYNVQELFRGDGHPAALLMFALALLWIGAGAAWLAARLRRAGHPGLLLPPLTLLAGLLSLGLLWSGVSSESLADIAGSSNLFWFVTQRDIWGAAGRELFLWLDAPSVIGFVEHCLRYSALYGPLPLLTALLLLADDGGGRFAGPAGRWRAIGLLVSAALLLWLCKLIAFSWSSTDNLNELIARDGPWGLRSGGVWLYLLLLLLCGNSVVLARAASWQARAGAVVLTLAAVPLGWTLLNLGLEQRVEKYTLVFSATQFLLGANRAEHLSRELLWLRWSVVQLGAISVIAAGLMLARPWLARQGSPRA